MKFVFKKILLIIIFHLKQVKFTSKKLITPVKGLQTVKALLNCELST